MQIHNLVQGTDAWHQFRLTHFGASEAAAMLGVSKKVKRNELLHMKKTGSAKEFSDWVQENVIDYGHEVEALALPIIEQQLGTDLYPATCSENLLPDHCGFQLSASCDGLTLAGTKAFEHKQWNEQLAASIAAGILPEEHQPQCQQIMLVTGAERVIFVVSDGTPEKMVSMEVFPDPEWRHRIINGWIQFAEDLKNYQHVEDPAPVIAAPVMGLPALTIQVSGGISLRSNLKDFGFRLETFVERIDMKPADDQGFANAEQAVKVLEDAQKALEAAENNALAQTSDIEEMRRTVAMYRDLARNTRLFLEKVVKNRKEQIRLEIQQEAKAKTEAHIAKLNERIGKQYMPGIPADFAGAMKGKKTISSLRDAVDTELARVKIQANEVADRIQFNLVTFQELASDHEFLFADIQQVVLKTKEDCSTTIRLRITEHKEKEEKRLAAERARIAEEERIKAEAKVKADAEEAARQQAATPTPTSAPPLGEVLHATLPGGLAQAIAPTPTPTAQVSAFPTKVRREIPTDDEIIAVVANAFEIDLGTALGWIRGMDVFQKSLTIAMHPVESSQIKAVGHDRASNTLAVEFNSGSTYHYKNVTSEQFDEFLHAESIGSYFGKNIKNNADRFPYLRVG